MREILFRGKTEQTFSHWDDDKMEEVYLPGKWIYGGIGHCKHHTQIMTERFMRHINKGAHRQMDGEIELIRVIPETVGEYTGFDDKNGNKIFEGNIVNVKSEMEFRNGSTFWYENKKGSVEMSGGHWAINIEGSFLFLGNSGQFLEIIGNIHDNPELLEV